MGILPARRSTAWMFRGACLGEDPELFFPVTATGPALQEISSAKAICGRCAVRVMCLSYALATRQSGVWGGTTGEERDCRAERPGLRPRQPGRHVATPRPGQVSSPAGQ
jgi:WhiB family transcriptional regulator, redox-sensing transcriptional regulator